MAVISFQLGAKLVLLAEAVKLSENALTVRPKRLGDLGVMVLPLDVRSSVWREFNLKCQWDLSHFKC
jgi:hypothetical protein